MTNLSQKYAAEFTDGFRLVKEMILGIATASGHRVECVEGMLKASLANLMDDYIAVSGAPRDEKTAKSLHEHLAKATLDWSVEVLGMTLAEINEGAERHRRKTDPTRN